MTANLLRYTAIYIAAAVALAAFGWALGALVGFGLPTGISTVLPPLVAALLEGRAFARHHGEPVPSGRAWAEALKMTVVVAVISIGMLAISLSATPGYARPPLSTLTVITSLLLVVTFLVNRYFFSLGAEQELRREALRK